MYFPLLKRHRSCHWDKSCGIKAPPPAAAWIQWIRMQRAAQSHSRSSILRRSAPVCSAISTALCISDMSLKCVRLCDLTYFLEWLPPHQNRLTLVTRLVLLAHRNSIRNKVAANCLSLFQKARSDILIFKVDPLSLSRFVTKKRWTSVP